LSCRARELRGLFEDRIRLLDFPCRPQREPKLAEQLEPSRRRGYKQRSRAPEQVDCRRRVGTPPRPQAGRTQPFAGLPGELQGTTASRSDLDEIAVRLLEMEPDDLVGNRRMSRKPASEPLVKLRTLALRQRRVGRVADENVVEADDVVVALDQEPFVSERNEVVVDALEPLGPKVLNRPAVEL